MAGLDPLAPLGDVGSTPAASPQSVQVRRALALALQKQGMDTSAIRSPWQGVGRIAQSLAGGYEQYQADQGELAARKGSGEHLAAALKNNDLGAAIGAMSDPNTNPEAAKLVAGLLTPQRVETGTGSVLVDRQGQQVPGSFIPKTINAPEEYGPGTKFNQFYQGTQGGGVVPMQAGQPQGMPPQGSPPVPPPGGSGVLPVFSPNGTMMGNQTSNQGQPPAGAPPAGVVAQAPAGPLQTPQQKIDFANQAAAQRKGAETSAELKAKDLDSVAKGVLGNAQISAQQKPNIKGALGLVENYPSIALGAGNEAMLPMQRLAAQIGVNPNAATPRELFNTISAKILADQFSGMKAMANEAGSESARIFAPMLALEEKANIQPGDSVQGTIAKLKMMDKMGDNMMRWGNMVNDYRATHGAIDDTFHKKLREEISKSTILDFSKTSSAPKEAIDHLRSNPQLRQHFDEKYGQGAAASVLGQ